MTKLKVGDSMPVQMREYPIITGKDAERFIKRANRLKHKIWLIEHLDLVRFEKKDRQEPEKGENEDETQE